MFGGLYQALNLSGWENMRNKGALRLLPLDEMIQEVNIEISS